MDTNNPVVKIDHLKFNYKKHIVFEDLSLEMEPGRIYGLLGENGVGKTTLLRIICGLLRAKEGSCTVDGIPSEKRNPAQFQKLCLTFEVDPGYRFDKLSHGQQKKALIAFALALNTRILLMDEPSNGLDIPSKTTLRRVISECATEERIIAISTHQVRDLENLIDPVIILDRSGLILNASIEQISEKLLFTMSQELDPEAYWSESSLSGYYQVIPNREGMPSRVNLEALFNAALRNKETFKTLFR